MATHLVVATLLLTLDAVVLATEIFSTTDIGIAYVAFLDSPTSFNSWEIETNGDSLNLGTTFTADGIRAGGTVEFVQGDDLVLHVPANTTLRVTKKGSKIVTRGYRSGPLFNVRFQKEKKLRLVAPFLLPFLLMRWSTSFADRFYCISRLPVQVTGTLVITDLTFTVDSDYGGAVLVNPGGVLRTQGAAFSGCSATVNGGAILNRGIAIFSKTEFRGGFAAGLGGQIYNTGNIMWNGGVMEGGGATAGGGLANVDGSVYIYDVEMFGSTATSLGGDILNAGVAAKLTLAASALNRSYSSGSGGSIAMTGLYGDGGNGGSVVISSTTFMGCGAAQSGGCVHSPEGGNLTLRDTTFAGALLNGTDTSSRFGGAVYAAGATTVTARTLTFTNPCTSTASGVYRGGGIFAGGKAVVSVDGLYCSAMEAAGDGACVFVTDAAKMAISSGQIAGTRNASFAVAAAYRASVILDYGDLVSTSMVPLNVTGIAFSKNRGGAIHVASSAARVTDCTFTRDGFKPDTRTLDQ